MTEQNPPESGDQPNWAPPSGAPPEPDRDPTAPAPRPDPYAQFGNPLNDTWGTQPQPAPPIRAQSATLVQPRKKMSRASRWGIAIVLLALLAALGWLFREPIGDAWDWVYRQADDLVSDSADSDQGAAGTSTPPASEPGSFESAAEAEADSFAQWKADNAAELDRLGETARDSAAEMVDLGESAANTGAVDPTAYRTALLALKGSTLELVGLLNTAPESAIRNDFVSILLVEVDGINQMVAAVDSGSSTDADAAAKRLTDAGTELERLCRQYGSSAAGLC